MNVGEHVLADHMHVEQQSLVLRYLSGQASVTVTCHFQALGSHLVK